MSWKPIDFQGIISLDSPLVGLLEQYLEEKEGQLALAIYEAIPPTKAEPVPPVLPPSTPIFLKASDAIEAFVKRNYQHSHDLPDPLVELADWNRSVEQINDALWAYLEIIEGCVTELFQQLEQISLDQWHTRLLQVVGAIKNILMHRMEELIWAIKRLEKLLWKSRCACEPINSRIIFWYKLAPYWSSLLDRSLITHLEKNQEWLRSQYAKFQKRYNAYIALLGQAEKSLEKFTKYPILPSLDPEMQKIFIGLYQLLKLWELNNAAKALPARDFVIALRNALSVDKAMGLFRDYYNALRANVFETSADFKKRATELAAETATKTLMKEFISDCQAETHTLGATISHYYDFLLKSDPNPYVRTRLGFSEGTVDSDPPQTKPLLHLGFDVEALSELYDILAQAIKKGPQQKNLVVLDNELQSLLHELGQPLATHRMMRTRAERILDLLQQFDELGSFDKHVIAYIGSVFSKLLRLDWRYHVLHGIPLFHQLYGIHHGLIKPVKDRQHISRMQKFQRLLQQVQDWVKSQKTQSHFYDIELDINDIKGYLQDFLGYVQRIASDTSLTKNQAFEYHEKITQELLEYRYLFGNFFYQLRQNETEGLLVRRQFLFVDQYFESVEYKLYEIQNMSWPESESPQSS